MVNSVNFKKKMNKIRVNISNRNVMVNFNENNVKEMVEVE